jgi:hypothetical protein
MGAGGREDISGTVNGVDLTSISVSMSSEISSYQTGYVSAVGYGSSLDNGTYTPSLADVQTALPNVTWGNPTLADTNIDTVVALSLNGKGYDFLTDTAHFFKFTAAAVNVTAVPEPATVSLLAGAGLAIALGCQRQFSARRR